jgi:transposase-like protein
MQGYSDRQFFLEPQQTFHRQDEALRAVFVEGQSLEPVARRFGYKLSTLQAMVSRFRADRRRDGPPPFFARTAADGPAGPRRAQAALLRKSLRSPMPGS